MRNGYSGTCYRCNMLCEVGDGHFERFGRGWRVQHASCAILYRGEADPARRALDMANLKARAASTGKRAQRARQQLGRIMAAPVDRSEF